MLAGRTLDQKRRLVQRITDVLHEELGSNPDAVVVTLIEVPRENYARGGTLIAERDPSPR
jgi:4-oxalocrotonate tautomerase